MDEHGQYGRVACRRSCAAARFKRWSLLISSCMMGSSWMDENDARLGEVISILSIANDDERRGRVDMGLLKMKNKFFDSDCLHFPYRSKGVEIVR